MSFVCGLLFSMLVSGHSNADEILPFCEKAMTMTQTAYEEGDNYDRFLATEVLLQMSQPVDLGFLFKAIDPQTPFQARSAMSTILSINKIELTQQLIDLSYSNEELAELFIQTLQYQTAEGVDQFISRYLDANPVLHKQVWAIKAAAESESQQVGEQIKKNYKVFSEEALVQVYALYALTSLNITLPEKEKKVLHFAQNTDPFVREMAAVILGELARNNSTVQLEKLIADKSSRVRVAALASLIKVTGGDKKEELLSVMLGKTKESEIAAGSLKRLDFDLAIETAEEYLQSPERILPVALRTMESIGSLKGGDATDLFRKGFSLDIEDLTIQILFAIVQRNQVEEGLLILPLLDHKSSAIRNVSSWALLKHSCVPGNQ